MKKGSALLIVLGMISFMLFSGIAFSVYMRQSRLPSAFLRRTTVTRQLTKAALAEAIEEIDYMIGNDPHPNVRSQADKNQQQMSDKEKTATGNYWNHRVFVRNQNYATSENGYTGSDTISTLTLEGLAYLPPCLINEVRYYSRHTPTARWQRFRFDAGRYAYTAIDVSDYFDVNRMLMDFPRSSASSRRITLAHMFEANSGSVLHGKDGAGAAADWEELLEQRKVRKVNDDGSISFDGMMPLISLADFNLAINGGKFGDSFVKSPFSEYLDFSGVAFYNDAADSDTDGPSEAYRSMTLVTDSFPRQPSDDDYKDLEDEANQPFKRSDLEDSNASITSIFTPLSGKTFDNYPYYKLLPKIGMASLYDYLDEDHVPVSLSVPTVERNPMICAIKPDFNNVELTIKQTMGELKDAAGKGKPSVTPPTRTVRATVNYIINGATLGVSLKGGSVGGCALYPFLRTDKPDGYALDGKLALFLSFVDKARKVRMSVNNGNENFAFGKNGAADPETTAELNSSTGILSVPLSGGISAPSSVTDIDTALVSFTANAGQATTIKNYLSDTKPWVSVTYEWEQTYTPGEDKNAKPENDQYWLPQFNQNIMSDFNKVAKNGGKSLFECTWPILDEGGHPLDTEALFNAIVKGEAKLQLNMALWLRIKNTTAGKTVDMVPACIYDDKEQGLANINVSAIKANQDIRQYYMGVEGLGRHLMRFDMDVVGGGGFAVGNINNAKTVSLESSPKRVMVADPRYNHNPANWFQVSGDGDLKAAWKDNANNPYASRDGDVFMGLSDQGYLQSIYELGALPRLTNITPLEQVSQYGSLRLGDFTRVDFAGSFADTQQRDVMWETYRVFARGNEKADDFDSLELVSGRKGLKVNPYSDSPEVISAAFANTPCDWAHASTNETANPHCRDDVDTFNNKYAWNAYGASDTRMSWDFLQDLGDRYQSAVSSRKGDWESAYEDIWQNTGSGTQYLCGQKTSDYKGMESTQFYSVDKEYLYGFWRDCFSPSQQLFLIFVRAEPMMMGGGIAGNAPPQLSARAVALVWRDPEPIPNATSSSSGSSTRKPHAMRILFYHPLD